MPKLARGQPVVIHVTNCYYPTVGGISTNVAGLREATESQLGVATGVVAYPARVHHWTQHVKWSPVRRGVHAAAVLWTAAKVWAWVVGLRLARRRVIVHSHSAGFCLAIAAVSVLLGARAVHTIHTSAECLAPGSAAGSLYRWAARRVAHIVYCCEFLERQQNDFWGSPTPAVVYFGAWDAAEVGSDQRRLLRSTLAVGDAPLFVWVGNLEPWKDPDLAVEALTRVPEAHLVMLGGGALDKEIAASASKHAVDGHVHLLGIQPAAVVGSWMCAADGLLLTSRREGLPSVLLEAMVRRCLPVAVAVGGVPEVIEDGETGYLITARKPDAVADAMRRLLEDDRRKEKGAFAQKWVQTHRTWEQTAEAYGHLYGLVSDR